MLSSYISSSSTIKGLAHKEAAILFGSAIDERMQGSVRVTVIAAGMEAA
jgi:cell division GTPase FtsZ